MIKIKLTLIIMFVSAFVAGISTGRVLDQSTLSAVPPPFMLNELNLTPEQQQKARLIWGEVFKEREAIHRTRETLRNERDQETLALLNESQKPRFAEIQSKYAAKQDAMTQSWKKLEDDAVEQTKSMLNTEQRKKFETMLDERAAMKKKDPTAPANADPKAAN